MQKKRIKEELMIFKTGIKREEAIPKDCVKPVITSPELELV